MVERPPLLAETVPKLFVPPCSIQPSLQMRYQLSPELYDETTVAPSDRRLRKFSVLRTWASETIDFVFAPPPQGLSFLQSCLISTSKPVNTHRFIPPLNGRNCCARCCTKGHVFTSRIFLVSVDSPFVTVNQCVIGVGERNGKCNHPAIFSCAILNAALFNPPVRPLSPPCSGSPAFINKIGVCSTFKKIQCL